MILGSCVDQLDSDPFGSCPAPETSNAIGLKVAYSPYQDNRYSTDQDTVALKDFSINFEVVAESNTESNLGYMPGKAFALSCIKTYRFKNISNIAVTLLSPFNGLPVGTDISYLLQVDPETTLNRFREFDNISNYLGANLTIVPENYEQLKTRTFLFLKDGSKIIVDSTSPRIKIN